MTHAAVTVEGGFFPPDLLDRVAAGEADGQRPADFGVDGRLGDELQAAFSDVRAYWDAFGRRLANARESASRTSLTREAWVLPLLERLGFDLAFQRAGAVVGGETFALSHRAGEDPDAPPVHVVAFDSALDRREGGRRSPHALVQEYLNRSDALWGLVTNGERLRLLRDSARLAKPTYVEFDLRGMVEGNLYSEFVLLYRLLHRSRFPAAAADAAACRLEAYYQEGLEAGGRVRERLREGVERALEALGNGFLAHPASADLRAALASGNLDADRLYRELLRLVYRLLFLFVAEERRLIYPLLEGGTADGRGGGGPGGPGGPHPNPSPTVGGGAGGGGREHPPVAHLHDIYDRYYAVARLRDRCERPFHADRHADLWRGLVETFRLFREDDRAAALGLTALGGELFGGKACEHLEGAEVENAALLRALFHLTTFNDGKVRRRVNYAALDVEELGSVYESLLEYRPAVEAGEREPFRLVAGSDRKTTGSYYTPPSLVRELVESALVPVMGERLAAAKTQDEKERALLGLRVCDPASGSGHFLLAAARRLGRELARVRTGEPEPTPDAYRQAVREVVRACLYAVDRNPLAVDLCKVALWLEGHAPGEPLTFLDHHVKCGDSLVGVADLKVLADPIPDGAFAPVTGDDKATATLAKKLNKGQLALGAATSAPVPELPTAVAAQFRVLAEMDERTAGDVRAKEELYASLRERGTAWSDFDRACDLWTAAFFTPFRPTDGFGGPLVPTTDAVRRALTQPGTLHGKLVGEAVGTAERLRFFHWPLEYPDVAAAGGFDVVLGNPPWERIKLQEEEFFAQRDPEIAGAANKAARGRLIATLPERKPDLAREFARAKHDADAASKFIRGSGRFPLAGRGDVNTYSVFAEHMARALNPGGRAGVIVPTGIATDDTNKLFFRWLVDGGRLASIYDFENRQGLFPAIDSRIKFSLLTVTGRERPAAPFEAAFFLLQPAQLREPQRRVTLTRDDVSLLNPASGTCPIVRSTVDLVLLRKLYSSGVVLGQSDWQPYYIRLIDLGDHANEVDFEEDLPKVLFDRFFDGIVDGHQYRRLYEAKMMHQLDHRLSTFEGVSIDETHRGGSRYVIHDEYRDPKFVVKPRYWVRDQFFRRTISKYPSQSGWLLAYRDICRSTDERTCIAAAIPETPATRSLPCLGVGPAELRPMLLANLTSMCLDYVVRQKNSGVHLTFTILTQLPVITPAAYSRAMAGSQHPTVGAHILANVLELAYTAHDLAPFARACGHDGPPFRWDEARRAHLRAELDAIYAHLYGLDRDDFAYVLSTFPVLRNNETRRLGEYRTERLALAAYERFAGVVGAAGGVGR